MFSGHHGQHQIVGEIGFESKILYLWNADLITVMGFGGRAEMISFNQEYCVRYIISLELG